MHARESHDERCLSVIPWTLAQCRVRCFCEKSILGGMLGELRDKQRAFLYVGRGKDIEIVSQLRCCHCLNASRGAEAQQPAAAQPNHMLITAKVRRKACSQGRPHATW